MLQLKDQPIRKKMIIIMMMTSGIVVILTCAVFAIYELITFRRSMVNQLKTLGKITAANSTAALAFSNPDDATEVLAALKAEPHIIAAALYDRAGRIFAKYPAGLPDNSLPPTASREGHRFEKSSLIVVQPVVVGTHTRLGTLYLQSDLAAIYDRLTLYGILILIVLAGTFVLGYLISRIMQRQISKPILDLARTAEAVAMEGNYSVRAVKTVAGEVGLLTDTFNKMLDRINEQTMEAAKREEQIRTLNEQLEQRVRDRTAELEAANKELEAFSYSVSHDLRAPLRHILGFGSLLQAQSKSLDDKSKRYLGLITSAAERMGVLIDDMLEFSRMGRIEMRKKKVDTHELVSEIIQSTSNETTARRIIWKQSELPPVIADPAMLRQVFQNLIANAVKYTRNRDTACIELGTLKLDNGEDAIFVRDNGVGFDMKHADKLFGVFQRLHLSEEFEGTGIGLASVSRIIKRHGGRIWAEAQVDQGATFYFTLPMQNLTEGQKD